ILGEHRSLSAPMSDEAAKKAMSARSRRSFLIGGAAAILGLAGWRMLSDATKEQLYRRSFEFNERLTQAFFSPSRLAREFRPEQVTEARVNGGVGLGPELDMSGWRLRVGGLAGRPD